MPITRHIKALTTCMLLTLAPFSFSADDTYEGHGLAMHGAPKYPADFSHFEYTNPNAPKGGVARQSSIGTFDSFNPFIIKGTAADGIGLLYEPLMTRSHDEAFSSYGLLAERVSMPLDRSGITFYLRKEATFSDGHPVTSEDVKFTFDILREKGRPFYRSYYGDIASIGTPDDHTVVFTFKNNLNKELPLIVGDVSILPAHYWQTRDFTTTTLEQPVGSGPYTIASFDEGRSITYSRRDDYWGEDLSVNKGRHNFDQMIFDYYKDTTVAMEAFKAGEYDFREENSSKRWATAYTGPAFDKGDILTREVKHENPTGMQAFVMNLRRPKFQNVKLRQALTYAFDFERANAVLFHNAYKRTHSYFSNSEMAATELPSPEEVALLAPYRDQLPPEVFTKVYAPPKTKGNGKPYRQLRTAKKLLLDAGYTFEQNQLIDPATGQQLSFEILLVSPAFERIVAPFVENMKQLGINVNYRLVDVSQYINRLRSFDFDMIVGSFGQSSSPGNEQRDFWSSSAAEQDGSRNWAGIQNPVIDELIELVISAESREQLVYRTRALDRVLQWNHYMIPQFHIQHHRIAYSSKFDYPETHPKYSLGFDTWWVKPE